MHEFTSEGLLDGRTNMDRDRELLRIADGGGIGCRVYGWDGPWVSLGRFQSPETDVVRGFDNWVIRPTGGKAVLHGHDVTVGLAMPLPAGSRSVKLAFHAAVTPLIEALNACGLRCVLSESLGKRSALEIGTSADCFAGISPYDVVDLESGQKVCGSALHVTRRSLLLQASIPYTLPLVPPSSAIAGGVSFPVLPWDHTRFAFAMRGAWSRLQ
jgi:lipoate-protein ligase A